jgi:hypothetical protein
MRFRMSFGSGRLVATRAAVNVPIRFDGGEFIYNRPLWQGTAFLTRPVEDNGGISVHASGGGDVNYFSTTLTFLF